MVLFTKIFNRLKLWTIFAKSSVLDLWWGSEYACFYLKHLGKEYSRYITVKDIYKWI